MATRKIKAHRDAWGSVRQLKSGRWQVRYPAPDGTMRSAGTFQTRREAEAQRAKMHAAIDGGTWRDPRHGSIVLEDYVQGWLDSRADLRDSTRALHERLLRTWIATDLPSPRNGPAVNLGARPVGTIRPEDVREWFSAVTAESSRRALDRHRRARTSASAQNRAIRDWAAARGRAVARTGRLPDGLRAEWEAAGGLAGLADQAPPINAGRTEPAQAYRLLHAAMRVAVEENLLLVNPCTIKRAASTTSPERRALEWDEVAVVAGTVPERYAAAVWVAASSSLRAGELFALRRRDFDPRSGVVHVHRTLTRGRSGRTEGRPKTAAGDRPVPLGEPGLGALMNHLERFTPPGSDALIFGTASGRAPHQAQVSKMLAPARQRLDRPDLRWHDLRHTGATLFARAGATTAELQQRLGHASPAAAMRYQHASQSRGHELARRMAEQWASSSATRVDESAYLGA